MLLVISNTKERWVDFILLNVTKQMGVDTSFLIYIILTLLLSDLCFLFKCTHTHTHTHNFSVFWYCCNLFESVIG
jgi:hypothetical protein